MIKLVLMDLDETLLHSDRTISDHTVEVLKRCQNAGILIGFCTARGETNCMQHINRVRPDVIIASGGAMIRACGRVIYSSLFTADETRTLIDTALRITNGACELTVDTIDGLYWNYHEHPGKDYPDWPDIRYTDYSDFTEPGLKFTINLPEDRCAEEIAASVGGCDWFRFVNGQWYKFTKPGITKVNAIRRLADHLDLSPDEIAAFGDDRGDMEMLEYCGLGVAVANAIPDVLQCADVITLSNDQDGVAAYLEQFILPAIR